MAVVGLALAVGGVLYLRLARDPSLRDRSRLMYFLALVDHDAYWNADTPGKTLRRRAFWAFVGAVFMLWGFLAT